MSVTQSIKSYLEDELVQRKINSVFCFAFFSIITLNLLSAAFRMLPQAPLFFFTCDPFEVFVAGIIAYLLFYKLLPLRSLRYNVFGIGVIGLIFSSLSALKIYRKNMYLEEEFLQYFTSYVGMAFLFVALFYIFKNINLLVNNSYVKTKVALEEAERLLLRQQFNPHFLYNAFNSLYSMSIQNHPNTSDSILKLSGMMRYLTDDAIVFGTLLKHELKFIKDYLEIEKIRFGEQANISFKIDGVVEGQRIEPLLLITLVENAFKHGFYTNNEFAFVNINLYLRGDQMDFDISNSVFEKQHFQKTNRKGKGLDNLRKRLKLSYGEHAEFKVVSSEKEYTANLKLTLK